MEDLYWIFKGIMVTEKSTQIKDLYNKVSVVVDKRVNKAQVKKAAEELFKVKVESVNIMNVRGKKKRVGYNVGMTPSWKKAVITLAEGETLDILEGL